MSEKQPIKIEINFSLPRPKRLIKAIRFIRSHRRIRLSLLLLLLAIFYVGVYEGVSVAQAMRLIRKGEGFSEDGMYQEALAAFQEADSFWRRTLLVHRVKVSPTTWRMNDSANEISTQELSHMHYEKGIKSFKDKKWNSAISSLSKVDPDDPDYADAQQKIEDANSSIADAKKENVAEAPTQIVYRTVFQTAPAAPHNNTATQEKISQLEDQVAELEDQLDQPPEPDEPYNISLDQTEVSAVVQLICFVDWDGQTYQNVWQGSGTVIHSSGVVLTNRHVVANSDGSVSDTTLCAIGLTNDIGQSPDFLYWADVGAYSTSVDAAILYVWWDMDWNILPDSVTFTYLSLGSSGSLNAGDSIWVVGYPSNGDGTWTITQGIVSGKVGNTIKTDAQIDNGNSGGAAINANKELVGIPTYNIAGSTETLGYIVGIDQIVLDVSLY